LRAEVDDRSETLGYRIRDAETQKIPLTLVIGDDELSRGTVAPRLRKSKQALEAISADVLVETLRVANTERRSTPFA
jgi:threonyl-tRNA synthetase